MKKLPIILISIICVGCIGSVTDVNESDKFKKGEQVSILNASKTCNCIVEYCYDRHTHILCEDDVKRMFELTLDTCLVITCKEIPDEPIPIDI